MIKKSLMVAGIVAALALSACGGTRAAQSKTSASAGRSTGASSGPVLNCSLPIINGQQAGFLSIPSGTFSTDPSAGVSGNDATYDRPFRRWLPVSAAQMLPDGSAYAYAREASPTPMRNEIHLVDVATGSDRMIYNQGAYDVVAYRPEGLYLEHHVSGTDGANGLWRLDPTSGSLTAYSSAAQGTWNWIGAGGAWSYSLDGSRFGSNSIARLDLSSGALQTWFTVASPPAPQPGSKSIRFIGLDGSSALVQVYVDEQTSQVWRITGPGQATRLPDLPLGVMSPPTSISDSHGTWLITPDGGVYLYANSAFTRVASAPASASGWFSVAGACS